MRSRVGIALIVTMLTFGGLAAFSGPAGAALVHTTSVNPSSGLSDGQTVTVSGTGFDETPAFMDWAVAQCDPSILTESITIENALNACDATSEPATFAHADAAGNLSTPFVVRKSFTTSSNVPVTCGQAPNDCAILVAQITTAGTFVGAAAPISFGSPVKTVAQCFRDFAHDHSHSLRYRLRTLLACVVQAVRHHQPH